MSGPNFHPNQPGGVPFQWNTINPAHAVQNAIGIISFAEPVSTFVVKRIVDAVRAEARLAGLLKEEEINTFLLQVAPGGQASPGKPSQVGTNFQKLQRANVAQSLAITTEAIRFDNAIYTRWVAFRELIEKFLNNAMPVVAQATQVSSIALEYIDFFYARNAGPADAQQIIDRQSDMISRKAFVRKSPFHSTAGWFEAETPENRRLVNVDVTVGDATGPNGVRRTITIRTHEAEQVIDPNSSRAQELSDPKSILLGMDALHSNLKKRLRGVLTRDAAALISLGS